MRCKCGENFGKYIKDEELYYKGHRYSYGWGRLYKCKSCGETKTVEIEEYTGRDFRSMSQPDG